MIETTVSNNPWYLIDLHYKYITVIEGTIDENYPESKTSRADYTPISIILNKETGLFELTVDLKNSNQQIDNNDSTRDSEFSKRTPRLS